MTTRNVKVGDKIQDESDVEWIVKHVTGNPSGLIYVKRELEDSLLESDINPVRKEWKQFAEWECEWYCLRGNSDED